MRLKFKICQLSLNRAKSAEIVFIAPRCRRELAIPPPSCGFDRIEHIKALGVTFTRKLSVNPPIDELLSACAKTLFVLRTLRQHGLPAPAFKTFSRPRLSPKCLMHHRPGGAMPSSPIDLALSASFDVLSISAIDQPLHQHSPAFAMKPKTPSFPA